MDSWEQLRTWLNSRVQDLDEKVDSPEISVTGRTLILIQWDIYIKVLDKMDELEKLNG